MTNLVAPIFRHYQKLRYWLASAPSNWRQFQEMYLVVGRDEANID
jgi:hypothetical protein